MDFSGTVYVFDLDDTLIWTMHWYDEVDIDEGGYISDAGNSSKIRKALSLLGSHGYKLQMEVYNGLSDYNTFFLVVNKDGAPTQIEELKKIFLDKQLSNCGIKGYTKFTEYAAIINDNDYYHNINNLGRHGFNESMLKLYNSVKNPVILTARANIPGMNEKIRDVITERGQEPYAIYTQPVDSKNSGRWKGEVICSIAKQDDVDFVYFYDDNLSYITNAQKVIDENNLTNKVSIIYTPPNNKPVLSYNTISNMVKVANRLDSCGRYIDADNIDKIILKDR